MAKTGPGAAERLAMLFAKRQGVPITRAEVVAVAQQLDALKRIRRNGGARDYLDPRGIALFWGKGDRDVISALGIGPIEDNEFISYTPKNRKELQMIKANGHSDLQDPAGL